MKGKVDKDLVMFRSKLIGLMDQPSPYKTYISKTVPMLENLAGFYKQADGQTKRKILGCIFSEKLVYKRKGCNHPRMCVSVSVGFEEKRMSVLALAHTLTLFSAPLTDKSCNQFEEILLLYMDTFENSIRWKSR